MQKFNKLTAKAAPLPLQNINTDIIIRVDRLRDLPRDELGPYVFESWLYRPDGSEDPSFVLNRTPYRDAQIILAGENFACGSSREAAVWALREFGIRCVIAPSFGQIFFNNCFQNGVLPIVAPQSVVDALIAEVEQSQGEGKIHIDLEKCVIVAPSGKETAFTLDGIRRKGLLEGQDQIAQTLTRIAEIDAYQAADRERRPWIYDTAVS